MSVYHLRQGIEIWMITAVQLPDFYLALGRAYLDLPDLPLAESILQQGLAGVTGKNDEEHEGALASMLGSTLFAKGELDGALTYTQRALKIDEKVYGPDHPNVATLASNIGAILQAKGDLDGALSYTRRALKILESAYGPDNPSTKLVAKNLKAIEQKKKN